MRSRQAPNSPLRRSKQSHTSDQALMRTLLMQWTTNRSRLLPWCCQGFANVMTTLTVAAGLDRFDTRSVHLPPCCAGRTGK